MRHHLDVTGKLCPLPVLLAARRARSLAGGDELEVIGDDPAMAPDFEAWCRETGHALLAVERRGREVRCLVGLRSDEEAGP